MSSHKSMLNSLIESFLKVYETIEAPASTFADVLAEESKFIDNLMETGLGEVVFPSTLHMMVVVTIAKEWLYKKQARESPSYFADRAVFYSTRFLIKTNRKILQALDMHIGLLKAEPVWVAQSPKDRVSVDFLCVLPALRTFSSWLLVNVKSMTEVPQIIDLQDTLRSEIETLWRTYSKLISSLCNWFPAEDVNVPVSYLFEEDLVCIDLVPFEAEPALAPRYLWDRGDSMFRFPSFEGKQRIHPREEALFKIKGLILDAIYLCQFPAQPICVSVLPDSGIFFIYNELLAQVPDDESITSMTTATSQTSSSIATDMGIRSDRKAHELIRESRLGRSWDSQGLSSRFNIYRYQPLDAEPYRQNAPVATAASDEDLHSQLTDTWPSRAVLSRLKREFYPATNTATMRAGLYE